MPRKLIAFDEDTFHKLTQLGRDRMATIQELADEAFADMLRKHDIPIDLKDALRKSAVPLKEDTTKSGMLKKPTCQATAPRNNLKKKTRS